MTQPTNNPYGGPSTGIPGQRSPLDDQPQTAPDFTTPTRSVQWATVGFGVVASLAWILAAAYFGFDALFTAGFASLALLFLLWFIGIPVYLVAASALADKEITKNELKAALRWPVEVSLLALSGGNLRDNDGNRQFAQQLDREDDTSETFASGFGAYALVIGLGLLALLLVGTAISLFIEVLVALAVLAFLLYSFGMLAYFWTCGLVRESLSGKLLWTLAIYPWDMFKRVLGSV